MMKFKSFLSAIILAALSAMPCFAQGVGQLGPGQVWGQPTASAGRGQATNVAAILDRAFGCSTNGITLNRAAGSWVCTTLPLADLAAGSQDTVLGYWASTVVTATSVPNCTGALTYSTSTHTFGCNASAGTGTVTSAQVATAGGLTNSGTCTITTTGVCTVYTPGGPLNTLRNASLTAWFHGTSGTATTTAATSNWTAEGVFVIPTGASVTWSQQNTSNCPTGNPTFNCVKVTGNTSVTDVKVRFVLESYTAAKLAGQTVTFQFLWTNNSGSSITPTVTTRFPTTQDGSVTSGASWGASTQDLAASNMQACTNGSTCTEAYTLSVSSSATAGYEFVVDFGNNFGNVANTLTIGGGFDARVTPGVSTGANANPPPAEIRDPEADIRWNQRFYSSSYPNGTAAGASTHLGIVAGTVFSAGSGIVTLPTITYPTQMRAVPSVSYWDGAGAASKLSTNSLSSGTNTFTDGATNNGSGPVQISATAFLMYSYTSSTSDLYFFQYAADASIWGG